MSAIFWLFLGALGNAFSVILGAFGAHYFKTRLPPEHLVTYDIAIRYLFIHATGLMILGLIAMRIDNFYLKLAGIFFIIGMFLFSGSLFMIIATNNRSFGAITPLGGLCFIVAWLIIAASVFPLIKNN